jgi:hypothetical protein
MSMLRASAALIAAFLSAGCATGGTSPGQVEPAAAAAQAQFAQQAFWANLSRHCGRAYAGRLTLEPPGDEMLTGTEELIVHFRECGPDTLKLPFHVEKEATQTWDRSRTWVFMRTPEGLELRHDHRHEDGTPDERNWYGGHTQTEGTATRQEFILAERRAADGSPLGWRVEVVPGERYTYGTIRGGEWTWRVDFDLSRPVQPPPAPWGHEASPTAR